MSDAKKRNSAFKQYVLLWIERPEERSKVDCLSSPEAEKEVQDFVDADATLSVDLERIGRRFTSNPQPMADMQKLLNKWKLNCDSFYDGEDVSD